MFASGEKPAAHAAKSDNIIQRAEETDLSKITSSELAAITVSARIPEFWNEMPRLWFAQMESVVASQKPGDAVKFNLVVSKLGRDALQQVSDILFAPPENDKYQTLKERLLQVYEESAERQFQKLVGELELGSQKPSQLLRRMRDLGRKAQISEKTLHNLWITRLPSSIRAVLTVSQDQELENLANIADKITENIRSGEIAEVSSSSNQLPMGDILTQMHKMNLEIAALREEVKGHQEYRRNSFRGRSNRGYRNGSRQRSQSRSARTPDDPNWLCRFHFRYRNRAWSCEKPCAWKTPAVSSGSRPATPEN